MLPKTMLKPAGPDCLLDTIYCTYKGNCSTVKSTCFREGLPCRQSFTNWNGLGCDNGVHTDLHEGDDED